MCLLVSRSDDQRRRNTSSPLKFLVTHPLLPRAPLPTWYCFNSRETQVDVRFLELMRTWFCWFCVGNYENYAAPSCWASLSYHGWCRARKLNGTPYFSPLSWALAHREHVDADLIAVNLTDNELLSIKGLLHSAVHVHCAGQCWPRTLASVGRIRSV